MIGFFIPVATRGVLKLTTVVVGALSYAFILVPLASGLVNPRPLQNYLLLFLMWMFHSFLTLVSFSMFCLFILFQWGPSVYSNSPKLQNCFKQILFFYLSKEWLISSTETSSNCLLHFQIFGFYKLADSLKHFLLIDCLAQIVATREGLSLNVACCQNFAKSCGIFAALEVSTYFYMPDQITSSFVVLTLVYYILTQIEIVPNSPQSHPLIKFLKSFSICQLRELEFLLVPILVDLSHILMSAYLFWKSSTRYSALALAFVNIYHPWITLKNTWLYCLQLELKYLKTFTLPSKRDLLKFEENAESCCPICLEVLRVCRRTPCGHIFHWNCFRRCYLLSNRCPICRTELHL